MQHDPVRDEARRAAAARGLTPAAVTHLTRDALGTVDFAALAPVKQLLKRFFSDASWGADEDAALAALVGSGSGWWRHDLDDDFELEFGWRGGDFRMTVSPRDAADDPFGGPVVPEATPNPRSVRFVTPVLHDGPSRWYESADTVDDPRVARLFAAFDDVANVLVGPDFVAVGLGHPDRWEQLLTPVLRVVTTEFASSSEGVESDSDTDADADGGSARDERDPSSHTPSHTPSHMRSESPRAEANALERAWKELGALQPDEPDDLAAIVAAVSSPSRAVRQVAARMLVDAPADTAEAAWSRLLADSSRGVRRATVDAMVDAERPALRRPLERALTDADAWTRWKALRGLVDLGIEPSRAAVASLAEDPDFRVRLEAASALRRPGPG